MARTDYASVDDYIAAQPAPARSVLERVRATIREALPRATEGIWYQIPVYKLDGRMVLYFAGFQRHYSIYPATARVVRTLKKELTGLLHSKATIRVAYTDAVPARLISRIAKLRATEVAELRNQQAKGTKRTGSKKTKPKARCTHSKKREVSTTPRKKSGSRDTPSKKSNASRLQPLPSHPPNDLFATDFHPHLTLPGFFPGAGGFFHGHPNAKKRFFFFGTDFGPLSYQRGLRKTGGEPEGVATLRQLRSIVAKAGLNPDHCFLTNAVLCMRKGESATSKFPIWREHRDYTLACAEWHGREIAGCRPNAVVLMGLPHLEHFGKLLFPELESYWHGLKTIKKVYAQSREVLTLADGTNILLMLHPSFWHAHPAELKARAIEHLAAWASADERNAGDA